MYYAQVFKLLKKEEVGVEDRNSVPNWKVRKPSERRL
jgi:hypothetical protein